MNKATLRTIPLKVLLASVLFTGGFNQALFGDNLDKIINKMQKKYRSTKTIKIKFTEIDRFQLTGTETSVRGMLEMEGKNRFRLESEDQTLVSDGTTFWRYNKLENQVLIDDAKNDDQEAMLNNLLYEIKDHYLSYLIDETNDGQSKIYEIKLTPKPSEQSFFTSIRFWVRDNSWEISRVIYTDYNENETEFLIERMEFNPEIESSAFTFHLPEGTQVIDLRF